MVETTVVGGTSSTGTPGVMNLQRGVWLIEGGLTFNTGFSEFLNGSSAAWIMPTSANDPTASGTGIFLQGFPASMGSLSGGDTLNSGQDGYITAAGSILTVGNLVAAGSGTTYGGEFLGVNTGSLVKVGGGSLTLTGTNAETGTLTVQQGTLVAANSTSISGYTKLLLGDTAGLFPATLDTATVTYLGTIFSPNFTFAGGISVVGPNSFASTIQDDGGTVTYSGAVTIAGAGDTLTLNQDSTVAATLQFKGAMTSSTTGNIVVSNGGGVAGAGGVVGTDADLILADSVNVTGSFNDNQNPTITGLASATTLLGAPQTVGGAIVGLLGAKINAVNLGATTSPVIFSGTNSYSAVTNVTAGTVTVTGNESAANGGWNIGDSSGNASQSVIFAPGSTISVASVVGSTTTGAAILVGVAGQGPPATLAASGTVINKGALSIQRNGQLTDGGVWTQSGAMLIEPTGGVTASMNVLSGGSFTYNNTTPIQIAPASGGAGGGFLTISGTFLTNQGFSDPVATSTGAAAVTLVGGTLAFSSSVPTLVASAGSSFNFVLATSGTLSGGTISIPSGLTVSANNVISGIGGLTKAGGGTLTLGGPAVDTFTGGISVTGTLNLDNTALATATNLINSSNALTLNSGAVNVVGSATGTTSQTIANLSLTPLTGNSISINPGAGALTALTIAGAVVSGGPIAALNINYASGTTNGGTVGNDIVAWNPALANGLIGGGYTVTDSGGTGYATVVGGDVVRLAGSSPLPTATGDPTQNYLVNSSFSTINSATPGSLVEALAEPVAANSVSVDTTSTAAGFNLALGSSSLTLGAGMTFGGNNPYTITSATSTAGILSALSAAAIIFNNYDTGGVTIAAPILDNSGTAITLNGPGITVFSGTNQYSGTTTLSTGATLQIADPGSLGGGSYAGNINDNGTFEYSSSAPQTLAGAISGSGGITKDGTSSTLTLAGANSYTGPTVLKAGNISVANSSAITLSSSVTLGDPTATAGSVTLNGTAAFTYANPISVVGVNQIDTIQTSTANDTFTGAITLSGGSTLNMTVNDAGSLTDTGGGSGTGNLVFANTSNGGIVLSGSAWNIGGTVTNLGTGTGSVAINSVLGTSVTGVVQNSLTSPLILAGANTYTSGTTISAGNLQVSANSTFTNGSGRHDSDHQWSSRNRPAHDGGGTLDLLGSAVAVAGLTGSGIIGSSLQTSGAPKLTIVVGGATPLTYSGFIRTGGLLEREKSSRRHRARGNRHRGLHEQPQQLQRRHIDQQRHHAGRRLDHRHARHADGRPPRHRHGHSRRGCERRHPVDRRSVHDRQRDQLQRHADDRLQSPPQRHRQQRRRLRSDDSFRKRHDHPGRQHRNQRAHRLGGDHSGRRDGHADPRRAGQHPRVGRHRHRRRHGRRHDSVRQRHLLRREHLRRRHQHQ